MQPTTPPPHHIHTPFLAVRTPDGCLFQYPVHRNVLDGWSCVLSPLSVVSKLFILMLPHPHYQISLAETSSHYCELNI